jgi:cytochrome c5
MHNKHVTLLSLSLLALIAMLGVSSWLSPGTIVALQDATPTPTALSPMSTEKSWILVDLPANATQLEYGTEVYRLVCKACHGDKGQGLTDDWRAQWNPKDQNCWQSKCHALNHPPDGFYMPQVPAVVGIPLVMFNNALDLKEYIHRTMPWHDPASMTQKDTWSVTAYILKINGVDPGPDLNEQTAAQIRLRPQSSAAATSVPATPAPEVQGLAPEDNRRSPFWTASLVVLGAFVLLGLILLIRRLLPKK